MITPFDLAILARIADAAWPLVDLETLCREWNAGTVTIRIGEACGKSANAVIGKVMRLRKMGIPLANRTSPIIRGATPKPPAPLPSKAATLPPLPSAAEPSERDAAFALAWNGGMPYDDIKKEFRVAGKTIDPWRIRLGLEPRVLRRGPSGKGAYLLTPEGSAAFRAAHAEGALGRQLAVRFNVSRSYVVATARALGLTAHRTRAPVRMGGGAVADARERALPPEPSAAILTATAFEPEPVGVEPVAPEWPPGSYGASGRDQCQFMAGPYRGLSTPVCGKPVPRRGEENHGELWCAGCRKILIVRMPGRREASYVPPDRPMLFAGMT